MLCTRAGLKVEVLEAFEIECFRLKSLGIITYPKFHVFLILFVKFCNNLKSL